MTNIALKFLLFMILFNIACVAVAYTGFFGETVLYSDVIGDDPQSFEDPETILENLFRDPIDDSLPDIGIEIPFVGKVGVFSWSMLTAGILLLSIGITFIGKSAPNVIPAGVVGSVFLLMYTNSKKAFDSIAGSMDSIALYFVAMVGVSFFFFALILIMDYLSNQNKAG